MKNYDDNIKTHEWTHTHRSEVIQMACKEGELPVVNRLLELPGERLEGIDFNKGFEQACSGGRLPVVNRLLELEQLEANRTEYPPWYDFRGKDNDKNYHIGAGKKDTRTF